MLTWRRVLILSRPHKCKTESSQSCLSSKRRHCKSNNFECVYVKREASHQSNTSHIAANIHGYDNKTLYFYHKLSAITYEVKWQLQSHLRAQNSHFFFSFLFVRRAVTFQLRSMRKVCNALDHSVAVGNCAPVHGCIVSIRTMDGTKNDFRELLGIATVGMVCTSS